MKTVRPPAPLAPERAWDYALLLLGRQAYTSAEMRARLTRRGLAATDVDRTVGRLEELGLLDDRAYARTFVEGRGDRLGPRALRFALRRKGVDPRWIDAAIGVPDDATQLRAAEAVLRKEAWRFERRAAEGRAGGRGADLGGDPDGDASGDDGRGPGQRALARAYALLARRGFEPDVARAAVEAWSEDAAT